MQKNKTINPSTIIPPNIILTPRAKAQLHLIIENDFTLAGKYFRILVSGKGCNGFTYSVGFTDLKNEDITIDVDSDLQIVVDSFAAFYLGETIIDYVEDYENEQEGFTVTNTDQKKYHGKFWKKNKDLIPEMVIETLN